MEKFSPNATAFLVDLASDSGLDPGVIAAWMLAEEPVTGPDNPGTGNQNWLNIAYFDSGPGALAFSGVFGSPTSAAQYTTRFLKGTWGGASSGIQGILKAVGQPPQAQISAIQSSGWASSGYPDLPSLYAGLDPGFKAQIGSQVQKGGVAGLGGTGSILNGSPQSTYQFTVGSTSNPDEDNWTAVNRLAQEVSWYLFSDGETVYYIDGADLIAQAPGGNAYIDRRGDAARINRLEFTWDRTAYQYVSTHKRKGKVQHHTKLAKTVSPTSATLELICGIDEFRAGDLIVLSSCGPGDGRWLIADVRRSVFSPISELNLVPPMMPLSEQQVAGTGGQAGSANAPPGSAGSVAIKGGATSPAPGATWGRLDMGFDGNYGPGGAVAPYNGILKTNVESGWPGQGSYFAVLNDDQSGPDYTRCMYFAEGALPILPDGTHVKVGQRIGNPVAAGGTGAPGNFEIGPANTSNYDCLAKSYGLRSTAARNMVLAFAKWLQSLGASAPTDTSSAGGP